MFSSLKKYEQDETTDLKITTPGGDPILMEVAGKDVQLVLTVASRDCDAAEKCMAKFQNQTFRQMGKGKGAKRFDRAEDTRKQELRMAVICTRGWNLHDGGTPVPFTDENVEGLYKHPRYLYIRDQVQAAIADRAEFDPNTGDEDEDEDESGNS